MRSSRRRAIAKARLAPGFVEQLADLHTAAVGRDVGTAQVVAQQVVGLATCAHTCTCAALRRKCRCGDARAAGRVAFAHRAAVVTVTVLTQSQAEQDDVSLRTRRITAFQTPFP